MNNLGFDPGAHAIVRGCEELAEVTLFRLEDGRLFLSGSFDDSTMFAVSLRPDFLDEFVAQARTRETEAA